MTAAPLDSPSSSPPSDFDGLSHLAANRAPLASVDQLAWALRAARSWLGPEVEPAPTGMRRFHADMRLRVSDHPSVVTFRKAAYVDIGELRRIGDGWEAEIAWRASSLAPLFPVFAGTLVLRETRLSVSGWYAPPGGAMGRAADRAVLHIAAASTGRWFLGELDAAARRGAGGQPSAGD